MSGPKVVRIVTPEERQMIKNRLLIRLQHAIENLKKYAQKNGVLNDDLINSLAETKDHYEAISADNYLKIEREIPNQIKYLESEKRKLTKKVSKEKTSTWNHYLQLRNTYNELQKLLREKNILFEAIDVPKLVSKESIAIFRKQVDSLYDQLKATLHEHGNLTKEQKEIQKRLLAGDSLVSMEAWSKNIPKELN